MAASSKKPKASKASTKKKRPEISNELPEISNELPETSNELPETFYAQPEPDNQVNEPAVEYTTKIRSIGNSNGVILNNQLMDFAGLDTDQDIVIRAVEGLITIKQAEKPAVNTDLSTWDKQFKAAIKAGDIPEGDMFEGMENEFDKTEWQV